MNFAIRLLILMSVLSFSALASAQDDQDFVIVKKREIYEDSSEANRVGKTAEVHFTLTGVSPNLAPSNGLTAAYFLDRNSQVLAEFRNGKGIQTRYRYVSSNSFYQEYSTDTKVSQIGVHYKKYTGNSFYFRTGVDYSTVDYTYDLTGSIYSAGISKFKGESLIGSFVIGNQWQWENFTLGCDWIGLAAPLTYKISGSNAPADVYDRDGFDQDKKSYVTDSSGVLLRFYLGAAF